MTERVQRFLWAGVAVAAVGLTIATLWLVRYSRVLAAVPASSPYGLVYMSDRDGQYRLYSCNALGENDRTLPGSVIGDVLPACQTASGGNDAGSSVAFLRITDPNRIANEVGMWGTVCVLVEGRHEAVTVSGVISRVLTVAPAWSPDGDHIAFAAAEDSNADGKFSADETGLYIATLDGRAPRRVASGPADDTSLSWAPNGEMLLFQTRTAGQLRSTARLVDLSDGSVASRDEQTTLASWSPDGQRIATYSTLDRRVHVLNTVDGNEEYSVSGPEGELAYLAWLPDDVGSGRWLALVSDSVQELPGALQVHSADPDSALGWRPLDQTASHAFYPAVSPDGKWIVYNVFDEGANEPTLVVLPFGGKPITLFADGSFSGLACWRSLPTRSGR